MCRIRVRVKAQVNVSVSGMSEAWLWAGPGLLMRVCEIQPSLMALVAAWGAVRLLVGVCQPRPQEVAGEGSGGRNWTGWQKAAAGVGGQAGVVWKARV